MAQAPSTAMDWKTPLLFSCCMDMEVCVYTCCCRCCAYGEVIDAVQGGGECYPCFFVCCAHNCAACCQGGQARTTMRKKLDNIAAGPCPDVCVAFFCLDCMICQMKRELKLRNLHGSACVDEYYVQKRVDESHIAPGIPVMEKDAK